MRKWEKAIERSINFFHTFLTRKRLSRIFVILAKFFFLRKILGNVVYILGGKVTIEVDGQKMNAVATPQKSLLYYSNAYEAHVASLFRSFLKRRMIMVDIGASLGYYTLLPNGFDTLSPSGQTLLDLDICKKT